MSIRGFLTRAVTCCLVLAFAALPLVASDAAAAWPAGSLITGVSTDRSRYSPGESVRVEVTLHNETGRTFAGHLRLSASHLGEQAAAPAEVAVPSLPSGATRTVELTWTPPRRDFTGYRISIEAKHGPQVIDIGSSAVDVSSDWSRFPRYGYVSDFGPGVDADAVVDAMNRYHLNGIQFYDWQWKHHVPYSPAATWPDIANRTVDRSTVETLIGAAHDRGMMAMDYNLAYGGYADYDTDGSGVQTSWGLFREGSPTKANQDSHPLPDSWATNRLYLFDPSNPGWRRHIFDAQRDVNDHFAFDGWHIDTIGNRGLVKDAQGNKVALPDTYAPFAVAARSATGRRVLFNTVGGHGLDQVARYAGVDFVYNEVWENDGTTTYRDLAAVVDRARANTSKAVVIPAYMNKAYGQSTPPGTTRQFRDASVLLTDAVLLASGASHLELGDGDNMLSNEYFPNKNLTMSPTLREAIGQYYDFQVAYQNLLRDRISPAANRVEIDGVPTSADGRAGTVWTNVKQAAGRTVLHLINLRDNPSDSWRDDDATYPDPRPITGATVKLYVPAGTPSNAALRVASPDSDGGAAHTLTYQRGTDAHGVYLRFQVPELKYWDAIWLDADAAVAPPARNAFTQIEAEDNSFNAQVNTEPTQDAGGGRNVCCSDDGDYIAFTDVDFGSGASQVQVRAATASAGGTIELRTDRFDGPLVGRVDVPNTGGWQSWTTLHAPVQVAGRHDLYILFRGDVSGITNLNWLTFTR